MKDLINYLKARHALKTVVYYLVSIPLLVFVMSVKQFNDGGPCNPGTNVLILLLVILLTIILAVVNLVLLGIKGRAYLLPFLIHLFVIIIVVIGGFIW